MRIIFFGTGKFGIPTLKRLLNSEHEVLAVVTQPDRKKGRGYNVMSTAVKAYIEKAAPEISILQPSDINSEDNIIYLKKYKADLFLVIDYGQKLCDAVLSSPAKYCINLHPSLLPEYRGASPVNKAILDGREITGNTVFKMAGKMDAGDIILQEKVDINKEDTAVELTEKLSVQGAELVIKTLALIEDNKESLLPQESEKATYAHKINKKDGEIDWNNNACHIFNQIRAFQPWPGAYTYFKGKILKIIKAEYLPMVLNEVPGKIIDNKEFIIATGKGCVKVLNLQLEGKKAMSSDDFIRGNRLSEGERLGKLSFK